MATKSRSSRKRGCENLRDTSKVLETSEPVISKAKRRKKDTGEVVNFEDKGEDVVATDVQSTSYSAVTSVVSKPGCANKFFWWEPGGKTCCAIPNKEKGLKNKFKKTYASLSRVGAKRNQTKVKRNMVVNNSMFIETNKDIECKSAVKDDTQIEKEKLLVSDTKNNVMSFSNELQASSCEGNQNEYYFSQVIDSDTVFRSENGCIIYVQSPSLPDNKIAQSNSEISLPTVIVGEHQQILESEFSSGKCATTLGSIISTEPVSHVNHSHNPVLQPSFNLVGIPSDSQMPSLSANTSAITAISTPIPTFPTLPDISRDESKDDTSNFGQPSSTSRRENKCPANMFSEQPVKLVSSCRSTIDGHSHNHETSSFSDRIAEYCQDVIYLKKSIDPCSYSPVPIVDMSDETDHLLIKEQNNVNLANCVSEQNTASPSPEVISSSGNSQYPSVLKVNTWGAFLLQNLEHLYKHEKDCDLVLTFSGGEVLKVHRTVMLACTSLVPELSTVEGKSEYVVPSDLNYASVEAVIRFVYSGCLEIQESSDEMSAIYAAAKKLKVPILTGLMDRHFPYLSPSSVKRLAVIERNQEKHMKHKRQKSDKNCSYLTSPRKSSPHIVPQDSSSDGITTTTTSPTTAVSEKECVTSSRKTPADTEDIKGMKSEECEGRDGSVYYLVTNSKHYPQSSRSVRYRKTSEEEARPTRFELEEDSESTPLTIATWGSKSSMVVSSYLPAAPQVSTSNPVYPSSFSSTALVGSTTSESPSTTSSLSQANKNCLSSSSNVVSKHSHAPSHQHDQIVEPLEKKTSKTDVVANLDSKNLNCNVLEIEGNDPIREKSNDELMEKISSICKQLEEKESDDINNMQLTHNLNSTKPNGDSSSPSSSTQVLRVPDEEIILEDNILNTSLPVKSILKKSRNKTLGSREAKHVSFPLDENNELINEVAIYSLSKEPAQSLIEVQKTIGNPKPNNELHSPVKLTVSMKKKVLMNLSLSDPETISSSGLQVKKSHSKRNGSTLSQGNNKSQVNKGDISNHAKIISEVLKKYPHLVKDKKKIRLKILKKGNEKEAGVKTKSKVQYLVLSDGDSKAKPITKTYRSSSLTKRETPPQTMQNQQSFKCPECANTVFPTYFLFKKHVSAEHKDKSSTILASIENVPYACYICFVNEPLEFSDYYSYQQHMKDVHSKTELRLCNICGFRPGRKLELAYHQYTEHNKISRSFCFPKCDLCDHVAINDAALLKHRSQHTNADNYTCSVCGVKFCSFGALQGHMQTRLCQTKPSVSYKCPHCPLTFARSYNLKAHCKSSHKSIQSTLQTVPGTAEKHTKNSDEVESVSEENRNTINVTKAKSAFNFEKEDSDTEVVCETLSVVSTQSSSEAEALSTVANSLAASLGLPEETINHYMFTQDKMDYSNSMDGKEKADKVEESLSQPAGLGLHLVDNVPNVSEYQDQSLCYDKNYSSQAPVENNSSVSAIFPISVVPSQLIPDQIVPGQVLPSPILQGGCMSSAGGPVIGAAPQSWTYVTYQVPSASDDIPVVMAETASINTSVDPEQNTNAENAYQDTTNITTIEDISVNASNVSSPERTINTCEQQDVLTVTNAPTHVNIGQTSALPASHSYDELSSQYV